MALHRIDDHVLLNVASDGVNNSSACNAQRT
jgi:hypothetical protein